MTGEISYSVMNSLKRCFMSLINKMMWCANIKKKFTLHQDRAPTHTSERVKQYREENLPNFIKR